MSRKLLDKLLSHSVAHYQALFNDLAFHSHNAHHLGSLYLLGANDDQMEKAYKTMCEYLDPYLESSQEINLSNWRNFLGNRTLCKSYRDFFHDQLTKQGTDWHNKFKQFLLDDKEHPLINCVVSGLAHPLIHVGYAFELDNVDVAIEALEMVAVNYNHLHDVFDNLKPPNSPSKSALEIIKAIHSDTSLPIYEDTGLSNIDETIKNYNNIVMSYYNQWKIDTNNIEKSIEELFDLTVYLYGATHKPNDIEFDFFLLHLVTGMHGIRIMHAHLDNQQAFEHLLLQFFYFTIVLYISQLRPEINAHLISDYKVANEKKDWSYVINRTLTTKLIDDAHIVKVVRALRDAEKAYGTKDGFYFKTALKSVDNVEVENLWIGFPQSENQLNVLKSS